ncbi:hypothetical protein, partial [Escherichia coli]|uniref:hypothetical protein n=1 Tax=Escherichia coli TaxID=562 RepID=UPI001BCCE7AD
ADRNRSHWSTSKTPSYTKSVSWQHHPLLSLIGVFRHTNNKFIRIAKQTGGQPVADFSSNDAFTRRH